MTQTVCTTTVRPERAMAYRRDELEEESVDEPKAGPAPFKPRWWHWRSLICIATRHDPVADFDGKVFCWFCWRKLPHDKAKETAAHRLGL